MGVFLVLGRNVCLFWTWELFINSQRWVFRCDFTTRGWNLRWLNQRHTQVFSILLPPPPDDSCPSTAMASLSEEVLLVLKKVRQRKQDGTLYLMAERIAWGPEGKDRFTVSHLYSDIRCEYRRSQVSFKFDTHDIPHSAPAWKGSWGIWGDVLSILKKQALGFFWGGYMLDVKMVLKKKNQLKEKQAQKQNIMKKVVDGATLSFLTRKAILPGSLMSPLPALAPNVGCWTSNEYSIWNQRPHLSLGQWAPDSPFLENLVALLQCCCCHALPFIQDVVLLWTGQKISPDGKAKIQLQLVLHTGESSTFHFSNDSSALKDREAAKDLLQQLLPKFKKKANKELEEKNRWESINISLCSPSVCVYALESTLIYCGVTCKCLFCSIDYIQFSYYSKTYLVAYDPCLYLCYM